MGPLKYLTKQRNPGILLIHCEINLDLNWSKKCVIVASNADQEITFSITDTKLCVPVVILSFQDHTKLFEQLKLGFKRTINWNKYQYKYQYKYKYQSKKLLERPNQYLDYLIDPSFQQ